MNHRDTEAQRKAQRIGLLRSPPNFPIFRHPYFSRHDVLHNRRIEKVLLCEDPVGKRLNGVRLVNRNPGLSDDRPAVEILRYEMNGASRLRCAGSKRLPLGVQTFEVGQERRVYVDDLSPEALHKLRRTPMSSISAR